MAAAGLRFRSFRSPPKVWRWLPFTQLLYQSSSQFRLSPGLPPLMPQLDCWTAGGAGVAIHPSRPTPLLKSFHLQ